MVVTTPLHNEVFREGLGVGLLRKGLFLWIG